MAKKTKKKTDFFTYFSSYYNPNCSPTKLYNCGTPSDNLMKLFSDKDIEDSLTGFAVIDEPYPGNNSNGYGHINVIAKNRAFNGPFKLLEYRTLSAVGAFSVEVATFNGLTLTAYVKANDLLDMMKSGEVEGDTIKCDLTFARFGSSHFLVRVENESN